MHASPHGFMSQLCVAHPFNFEVDSKRYVKFKKNQSVATYKATVSQESNILLSYRHTQQHMKKLCFGENKSIVTKFLDRSGRGTGSRVVTL